MDEYIMTNDEFVEESYEDSCDDDVTLDDVDTYLESVKEDIIDAVNLYDDMVQEGYEYEDMSVEDVEMFIESSINNYNDGVDLYNTMIMESDDNVTDNFEESRDPSWSGENNGSDPRADRRKYMNDPNVQPWDKKQILDRANKADDLSRKRVIRRSRRDNVEEMPSRQYLMWKKDRDTWNDVADRDENEGLTHAAANSRKRANESQKLMNDIKDQRLAGKRAVVNESGDGDIDDFEIFGKGSPWDPRRKYKIKVDEKRFKEDDELRRKRSDNNDYVDDIDMLPSRDYIKAKELRGHYSKDPRRNKAMLSMIDQNMKDIVADARKARKSNNHVKEYALTSYRDNELDLEFEEPLTAYEFFDESYEPDNEPFIPYTDEGIYIEADGPEKHDLTLGGAIVLGAGLGAAIGTGINIINMLITEHKYGRFPHDMKRVYDIVQKADFKASANKRILKKALKAVSKDLHWMFNGIGGRWKVTVNEAAELKKLRKHVDDLYTRGWMLTRNEELSQKRRVPERIAEFVEQGNKVLKILNKTVYKNPAEDVTTEYMV